MSIVELLDEHDYSDEVRTWDKKVREYTRAPAMTPYVKAAAHHMPYLENMASEHLYVMPTRRLRRQLKETIAVAVSMVNNCRYCIVAHARLLGKMFSVTDAQLVELTAAVAHISGLNRFETAILSGGAEPLFHPRPKGEVPLLGEIEEALGVLPTYYQVMANDPRFLDSVWAREKATMFSGSLKRMDKEFVAFVTSIVNVAGYSTRLHKQILEGLGATEDELFEALEVTEIFHKNNKFTEGLQLEPGLWGRDS